MAKKTVRRANGEGTIYKLENGNWRGRCQVGYHANGKPKRISVSGKTKVEVSQKIAAIVASNAGGEQFAHNPDLTLGAYGEFWLNQEKRLEVGGRTFGWYKNLLEKYIVPALGGYQLGEVTTQSIQHFLNEQAQQGYSERQLTGLKTTLHQIYRLTCQNNLVRQNPVEQSKIIRSKSKVLAQQRKQKAMTIAEREQLLTALEGEYIMRPILITLLFTGMRIGELLALQWRHIDFEANQIQIEQALTLRPEVDQKGNIGRYETHVSEPKTVSSFRTIPIPEIVRTELLAWQKNLGYLFHLEFTPDSFVFCSTDTGTRRTYDGFRSSYQKFLKRHGLTGSIWHLHTYRHTCATMLLESGVNPKLVQQQLGHASITTTLNIYSHVGRELSQATGGALDRIYQEMRKGTYQPKTSIR